MNSANAGAKTILSTCAGLREGESLLIAADSDIDSVTREISNLAEEIGGQVTNLKIHGPVSREPPENIARSMLDNNITLFCVNEQRTLLWGHSDAKVAACKKGGRVLFLTQPLNSTPDPHELSIIRDRSNRLGDILEKAKEITLLTEGNSRLDMKLAGRKSLRLSSILSSPGNWGAVPDYAEAAVAPLETGSTGKLRVNGMIVSLGKVDYPVDLKFVSGKLVKIDGKRTASDFEKLLGNDPTARILCELGFGTNHLRRDLRGEFDDKKALGSVHIALGDNHTFGGENRSALHIDCLVVKPTVLIDGAALDLMSV